MASHVADTSLAAAGAARIEWADGQVPVLRSIRERFESERPLDGVRVAACLHVTAETANLVRALMAGGAQTALCAANPLSTQDDTAAALVERYGAEVRAVRGEDADAYVANVMALVAGDPQITIDDGADLISVLHEAGEGERAQELIGAMEETTTGLVRVRSLEADGRLQCPVFAVNEARTERAFNDRYGTGQSTLDGILRATNLLLAGHTFVVFGYGWTRRGVALRPRRARRGARPGRRPTRGRGGGVRDRLRGRPARGARGANGGLRGHARARRRRARRRLRHRDRRARRAHARALRAHEGRRRARQRRPLRRRDQRRGPARAGGRRRARGPDARRGVPPRRPAAEPPRPWARGQPRRRRGSPGGGDGHVVRAPGPLRRGARRARGRAGGRRPSRARADRPRGRGAEARGAGRGDRHAHGRAGDLPAVVAVTLRVGAS